jgi:tetratricopeptide (TPR) repeat protein
MNRIALALCLAHAAAAAGLVGVDDGMTGKRVVPRSSRFVLRVNDEPVPSRGQPLVIYRVERTDGPSFWLEPERPGASGWATAGEVIALEQADEFFTGQIRQDARDPFLHAMRGLVRLDGNRYEAAIADYNEAIRLNPADASLYCERAGARAAHKDNDQAVADYTAALRLDAKCTAALIGRGACRLASNERYKAIADLSEAIWLDPLAIRAYVDRGRAWASLGEHRKAIVDYDRALQIRSHDSETHCVRAAAWAALRSYTRALADYALAVRLDPGCVVAHQGRAWIMAACPEARLRNGKDAIASATKACELTRWQVAGPLATLAAAYAEAGDFEQAVEWQTKANAMALDEGERADGMARLALYRSKKPVRISD